MASDYSESFLRQPQGQARPLVLGAQLFGAVAFAVFIAVPVAIALQQEEVDEAKEAEARARDFATEGEWFEAATQWGLARGALRQERGDSGTLGIVDWELYTTVSVSCVAAALLEPDTATGWGFAVNVLRGMRQDVVAYPMNEGKYKEVRTTNFDLLGRVELLTAFVESGKSDPALVQTTWRSFSATHHVSLDAFRQWLTANTDASIGDITMPRHPFYPLLALLEPKPEKQ